MPAGTLVRWRVDEGMELTAFTQSDGTNRYVTHPAGSAGAGFGFSLSKRLSAMPN